MESILKLLDQSLYVYFIQLFYYLFWTGVNRFGLVWSSLNWFDLVWSGFDLDWYQFWSRFISGLILFYIRFDLVLSGLISDLISGFDLVWYQVWIGLISGFNLVWYQVLIWFDIRFWSGLISGFVLIWFDIKFDIWFDIKFEIWFDIKFELAWSGWSGLS